MNKIGNENSGNLWHTIMCAGDNLRKHYSDFTTLSYDLDHRCHKCYFFNCDNKQKILCAAKLNMSGLHYFCGLFFKSVFKGLRAEFHNLWAPHPVNFFGGDLGIHQHFDHSFDAVCLCYLVKVLDALLSSTDMYMQNIDMTPDSESKHICIFLNI